MVVLDVMEWTARDVARRALSHEVKEAREHEPVTAEQKREHLWEMEQWARWGEFGAY